MKLCLCFLEYGIEGEDGIEGFWGDDVIEVGVGDVVIEVCWGDVVIVVLWEDDVVGEYVWGDVVIEVCWGDIVVLFILEEVVIVSGVVCGENVVGVVEIGNVVFLIEVIFVFLWGILFLCICFVVKFFKMWLGGGLVLIGFLIVVVL